MTQVINIPESLSQDRRKQLRSRRSIKFWQSIWRLVFLSGLSAGLFWGLKLPYWLVTEKEQINVKGNELMTQEGVKSLISLNYPEYLWRLNTNKIIKQLESSQPIIDAQVTRQFLPLKVNIYIEERQPIALVLSSHLNKETVSPSKILLGFLDREGVFIPEHFYNYSENITKSTLKVIGYLPQYQAYWIKLVEFRENYPVKIFEIEWTSPTSILLKTEIGSFYLGNYPTQLEDQLKILAEIKQAPAKLDLNTIEYIDLSNPESPTVKMKLKQ